MPRTKEQKEGIRYEQRMAKRIGAALQPGSGSQWFAKLDLAGKGILWSLKWTSKGSFRITREILQEAIEAALKEGCRPAWMINLLGKDLVIMLADDFIALMEEEEKIVITDKNAARRRKASIPGLLRHQPEEE